jgi:hypothetical protein
MVYDAALNAVVLFGGLAQPPQTFLADLWTWNGQNWLQRDVGGLPPRAFAAVGYDQSDGNIVLFGGTGDSVPQYAETWAWDGTSWTQEQSSSVPPARINGGMVYDEARGELVLFGGAASQGRRPLWLNDTWVWQAQGWTQRFPSLSPSPRAGASMAYDPVTRQVLLFGGATTTQLNDTWAWDGEAWTEVSTSSVPPARAYAGMVFNTEIGRMILFGGEGFATTPSASRRSDTWLLDGTSWQEILPSGSPPGGHNQAMVYDAASGSILLYHTSVQKPAPPSMGSATMIAETWSLR